MRLADLTPEARKRVVSAWADPELTQLDIQRRFGLSDLDVLTAELGPKARLGAVSRWSINSGKKRKKQAAAKKAARAEPQVSVKFRSIEFEMEIETNAAGEIVDSKLVSSKVVR